MHTVEAGIVNPSGLHARPGNAFVKKAKEYASDIWVEKAGKRVNAKSLLSLMKVACSMGDRVVILAEGPDEILACEGLAAFVAALKD